jgi:TonB family protein
MTAMLIAVAYNISGALVGAVLIKRWLLNRTAAQTPRGIIMNWIIINLWIAMICINGWIVWTYFNKGTPENPALIAAAPEGIAAAPRQGAPNPYDSELARTWRAQLVAEMLRNKRYPEEARSRGEEGVVHVFFSLDRQGRLLESRLVRSSGAASLDEEALALLRRAQPFPAPPPDWPGEHVAFNVPIRFSLK